MKLFFIIESLIYFFCIFAITKNIVDCITEKVRFFLSASVYCFTLLLVCSLENSIFIILHTLFPVIQILMLYLSFKKVKLTSVIFTYFFVYCTNAIIALAITIISAAKYDHALWIEAIVNILFFVICLVLCNANAISKIQQIINWTPLSAKRLLLTLLITAMFLLSLIFDDNYYANSDAWFNFVQKGTLITVILLLIITGFLVCVLLSNNQLKQLTRNYEQQILAQAEHYKLLAESTYELRRFKHDFKNMSIAIESVLASDGNSQALRLFKQYNDTLENPSSYSMMFDTGNGIVDALLTDKQKKATSCNAKIVFQGAVPMNFLSPTDICVILGNTLDNAIEACEKLQTQEESVISVNCNCNSGFMFLTITNPICGKIDIQNNHISTTKENKTLHGFGLYSLQSIVKKYSGNIELSATDNEFTANIDLSLIAS